MKCKFRRYDNTCYLKHDCDRYGCYFELCSHEYPDCKDYRAEPETELEALQIGLDNLLTGKDFNRWSDEMPGSKDTGCTNFPYCGFAKTIKCPFDGRSNQPSGCWWYCTIETDSKELKIIHITKAIAYFRREKK